MRRCARQLMYKVKGNYKTMENKNQKAVDKLFANPPAKYRGAPFWAWNTDLREEELLWQIDRLKEMGFGGFFMHTRSA